MAVRRGMGRFAIPACIQGDVESIYGLRYVGTAAGVREQFFAVSLTPRVKYPGIVALRAGGVRERIG